MDVPHADAVAGACLLHRVVQAAAEDGEDIDIAARAGEQEAEGGDCGGQHGLVGIEADDFRESHQLPGPRPAQNVIPVGELRAVQFIQARFVVQADEPEAGSLQTVGSHYRT